MNKTEAEWWQNRAVCKAHYGRSQIKKRAVSSAQNGRAGRLWPASLGFQVASLRVTHAHARAHFSKHTSVSDGQIVNEWSRGTQRGRGRSGKETFAGEQRSRIRSLRYVLNVGAVGRSGLVNRRLHTRSYHLLCNGCFRRPRPGRGESRASRSRTIPRDPLDRF